MQRRFFIVLVPFIVLVLVAFPGGLSVQAMGGVAKSVTGPLALTQTAEPATPVPPPPTDVPATPVPPTDVPATPVPPTAIPATPAPSESGNRNQRTPEPTQTAVPPAETPSPTPEVVASPTPTPVAPPASLPVTGGSTDNSSLLLWLGVGMLAIALGSSLIRRRSN